MAPVRFSPPCAFAIRSAAFFAFAVALGALLAWARGVHELDRAWPEFAEKLERVSATDPPLNAVVLGSSVVRHHFVPSVLDSCTAPLGLRWFNLGLSASFPPESYALAERALESEEATKWRLVVMDVMPLEPPHWENIGTLRRAAAMDVRTTLQLLPTAVENPEAAGVYLATALTRAMDGFRFLEDAGQHVGSMDAERRGYAPLDTTKVRWDALRHSRDEFLKNPAALLLDWQAEGADFDYRASGRASDPNVGWNCPPAELEWHMKRFAALQDLAQTRGIHLVFLFQKLWGTNGCLYFEALEAFGPDHVVELMGSKGREAMSSQQHWYDHAHLNPSGAAMISEELGERLLSVWDSNP